MLHLLELDETNAKDKLYKMVSTHNRSTLSKEQARSRIAQIAKFRESAYLSLSLFDILKHFLKKNESIVQFKPIYEKSKKALIKTNVYIKVLKSIKAQVLKLSLST